MSNRRDIENNIKAKEQEIDQIYNEYTELEKKGVDRTDEESARFGDLEQQVNLKRTELEGMREEAKNIS
jgi:hypothetical protein